MFKVEYHHDDIIEVRTVYAVDRATESFFVITPWGEFEWVPIDMCILMED